MSRTQVKDWMKSMIDHGRLRDVLELLAEVCHEKADQDKADAAYWARVGNRALFSRFDPNFR